MPVPLGTKKDKATIAGLKEEYLKYFADCPIQKYAAAYIMRDEQAIIEWKKVDEVFRNNIEKAKAKWALKNVLAARAEFQLERLEKELFSERKEITGKDGGPIETVTNYSDDDLKRIVEAASSTGA